jgi:hypothetical protein
MPAPSVPTETIRFELPAPNDGFTGNTVLTGAAETITKPAGTRWVWLATSALTYFRFGGSAAAVPAADTATNGSMPLNPGNGILLDMNAHATLSVISAAAVVGYAFFRDREGGI